MAYHHGPAYMRTSRPKTPVIYDAATPFRLGGSHVVRSSADDKVTIVGAGITLFEALGAYDTLQKQGIAARVIDLYSLQPIDTETLQKASRETGWIVTVEDHYPAGGIGEAVMNAVAPIGGKVHRIAVRELPRSGVPRNWSTSSACRLAHRRRGEVAPLSHGGASLPGALLPLALASAGLAGGVLGARPAVGQPAALPGPRGRRDPRGARSRLVAGGPAHRALDPQSDLDPRPDGRDPAGRALAHASGLERDPAWSPDGRAGLRRRGRRQRLRSLRRRCRRRRAAARTTRLERHGRRPERAGIDHVFANRERGQWDIHAVDPARPSPNLERLTDTTSDETEPHVSPDGRLVVFVSTADAADGEADLWLLELSGRVAVSAGGVTRPDPTPLIRDAGPSRRRRGRRRRPIWPTP
jgi:hypothetical protein